jgi:hypothetical protein
MFWLGLAIGVVGTLTFLMAEHLLGQLAPRAGRLKSLKGEFDRIGW